MSAERDDLELLVKTAWRLSPAILLTSAAIGAVAYYAAGRVSPQYVAEALIMIEARTSTAAREQELLPLPDDSASRAWVTRSELAIAGSQPVAEAAVALLSPSDRDGLDALAAEKSAEAAAPDVLGAYRSMVSVSNDANSFLLRAQAEAPTALLASAMANAHALAYIALGEEKRRNEAQRILDAVAEELGLVAGQIAAAEREMAALSGGSYAGSPQALEARLASHYEAIDALRSDIAQREMEVAALEGRRVVPGDAATASLNARLTDLDTQIAGLSRFGERGPELARLMNQRGAIDEALDATTERLAEHRRAELGAAERRLSALDDERAGLETMIAESAVLHSQLEGLRSRIQGLEERRSELMARQAQVQALLHAVSPIAQLIEPAAPPLHPRSPRPRLAGAFGAALGAALCLGVGLWRERRRPHATRPFAAAQAPGIRHADPSFDMPGIGTLHPARGARSLPMRASAPLTGQ